MASPEIAMAVRNMSGAMRNNLSMYSHSLQSRYGDPRVYAMQQEQIAADREGRDYSRVKTAEEALEATYRKSRKKVSEAHNKRVTLNTPPESQSKNPRTGRQPSAPRSAGPKARSVPS